MVYYVKINNETTYRLASWDAGTFNSNMTLTIQSTDFNQIKEDFYLISSISILQETQEISTYTCFDTFSGISYAGSLYVEGEKRFAECMQVTLSKANLVEQVKRLDEQINPVVDITAMTLEEYKQYQLKNLSKDCTADIYAGDQVVLYDGHVETFSFDQYDQADLQSLANIAMMDPTVELTWHSDGYPCQFYSGIDIIIIYTTLSMKLFRDTTICNAINLLIKGAVSKDEVAQYYWGCELPEEDQERVGALITRMQAIVAEIMGRFMPGSDEEESNDEEIDDENTDGNDATE